MLRCRAFLPAFFTAASVFIQIAHADGDPLLTIDAGGHSAMVVRVQISPDAERCYTISNDKTVRVWDAMTGACRSVFRLPAGVGLRGAATSGGLSSDGAFLAVGTVGETTKSPGRTYLLDAESGAIVRSLGGHSSMVTAVAVLPGARETATGGDDHRIVLHGQNEGAERVVSGHEGKIRELNFSPQGDLLASASLDRTARLWDVVTGKETAVLRGHDDGVLSVAWSTDGQLLATGGADRRIVVWDRTGQKLWASPELPNAVPILAFSGPMQLVYGLGEKVDNAFQCGVLDLATGQTTTQFTSHDNSVSALAVSPDGKFVVSAGGNQLEMFRWQTVDGRLGYQFKGGGRRRYVVGWSRDGSTIAWGETRASGASLNDFPSLPFEHSFRIPGLHLSALGPQNQGDFTRSIRSTDQVVLTWKDTRTVQSVVGGAVQSELVLPAEAGQFEAVSSWTLVDAEKALVGSDRGLYLYELRTGQLTRTYRGHFGAVFGVTPAPSGPYFATASADQTVSVWRLDRETPLFSVFTSGREWITWTPEGFYAASPGGERLIGWLIQDGERTPPFHPAERFFKKFFRPDLIEKLLQTGGLANVDPKPIDGNSKTDQPSRDTNPQTLADALPPKVTLLAPAKRTEAAGGKFRIVARAEYAVGNPVTSMKLRINGRPHLGGQSDRTFAGDKPGPVEASWNVEVPIGRNQITVLAEAKNSQAACEPVLLVNRGGGQTEIKPRLFLLAVGVGKYRVESIPRLFFSADGAKKLGEAFQNRSAPTPYESVSVQLLLDDDATRSKLFEAFSKLEADVRVGDTAVVYFSGHGERAGDRFYLLPCDAEPSKLADSGVSGEDLKTALAALKCQTVVMLDACHSGEVIKEVSRDLGREANGLSVLCSSFDAQKSLENNQLKLGPFTFAVLECLAGKRGKSADGVVYFNHLLSGVPDLVDQLTNGVQQVTFQTPANKPRLPLAKP